MKTDNSSNKKTDLIKDEALQIKKSLTNAINFTDRNENIHSLVNVWRNTTPIRSLPNNRRLLTVDNRRISELRSSNNFIHSTRSDLSNMLERSDRILAQ